MGGKIRRAGETVYGYQPRGAAPAGHPKSLWVSEKLLLPGLTAFFNSRVFGEQRRVLLDAELATALSDAAMERRNRVAALRRALTAAETSRGRLVRSLERTDDPDGELAAQVNLRLAELLAERAAIQEELQRLEDSHETAPTPELLDALPVTTPDLARLPEPHARGIFEAFRLEMHYDRPSRTVRCRVTLTADTLPAALNALRRAADDGSGAAGRFPSGWCPRQGTQTMGSTQTRRST